MPQRLVTDWLNNHPRLGFMKAYALDLVIKVEEDALYDRTKSPGPSRPSDYAFISKLADPEAFDKLEKTMFEHVRTCSQCQIEEERWLAQPT